DDADGVECLPNVEIFEELARMGYEKPPPKLTFYKACSVASVVICLATVVMDNQVDDMTSHNTRYTSYALTQKVFVNMRRVGKGFSGVETPLFASILVADLEHDKHSQALEILQLKKRVKKLERKKKSKSSGLKRIRRVGTAQRVESSTNTILETDKEVVAMDAESRGRLNQEDVSAAEPTVFDDEDVTMTLAQTLIKLKAEKDKLLDEQIAQKLHDEEVKYPIIDWEIHTEGSRVYWKIIRVGGITEAYQNFEDMLKGFDREDLVTLWNLVKEKISSAVPSVDKEKVL
nr:hypothetical protein [Tanacetum cinerariifolium]GFA33093.1 hypothetical protein [Tanacetum cinerariifolium]